MSTILFLFDFLKIRYTGASPVLSCLATLAFDMSLFTRRIASCCRSIASGFRPLYFPWASAFATPPGQPHAFFLAFKQPLQPELIFFPGLSVARCFKSLSRNALFCSSFLNSKDVMLSVLVH